jgi:hypothetical protein
LPKDLSPESFNRGAAHGTTQVRCGHAEHLAALAGEGPAHLREDTAQRRGGIRQRRARRPGRLRVAEAQLREGHSFEKVGDHWVAKDHKGPSDPQAAKSGAAARAGKSRTYGGVDERGQSRKALYERAKSLGVAGRSTMSKQELADAIARKQR